MREVTTTSAPSSWQINAIALPIPRPPPVTNTFFPFRSCAESAEQYAVAVAYRATVKRLLGEFLEECLAMGVTPSEW